MIKNWLAVRTKENHESFKLKRTAVAKCQYKIACLELQVKKAREDMREEESKLDVQAELEERPWIECLNHIMNIGPNDYYVMVTEKEVCTENRRMLHWLRGSSMPLADVSYIPPKYIQDEITRLGLKFKPMRMCVHVDINRTETNDGTDTAYSYDYMEVIGLDKNRVTLHDDLTDSDFIDQLLRAPDIESIETDGRSTETCLDCVAIYIEDAAADIKQ